MKLTILNAVLLLAVPFSIVGNAKPTDAIANLTDGNYRYCTEPPSLDRNFEEGGWCFIFRKSGNRVVGNYFAAQKEQAICISGVLNNNTVSGTGLELWYGWDKPVSLEGIPESQWWDSPEIGGGRLRSNRLSIISRSDDANSYSAWIRYGSVQLNLNGFHRYSAGTRLAPFKCEAW